MELYTNNVQDRYGNAIVGAQVLVLKDGGSAVIYSDDGVTQTTNPLTTDADGEFRFYAATGKYSLIITSPRLPEPIEFPGISLLDADDINGELRDQLASTDANMGASMVGIQPYGSYSSTTVQGALEELDDDIAQVNADIAALTAADIAFDPAGSIAATDVQAALEELDGDITAVAAAAGDVFGPVSSTDNTLPRFNGTDGETLQGSGVTLSDADEIHGYLGKLNIQTGTTYTLDVAGTDTDSGKVIDHANAGAITVTLPNSAPVGFCCTYVQAGAGQITFSPASGATLRNRQSHTKTAGQYGMVTLYVRTNSGGSAAEYMLGGDTAA